MFDDWPHATIYLAATVSSYWKWSENGQEISWVDGPTIAFLPELIAVLKRLASDGSPGLPPLGSVLLLLAACRNNWREPPSRRGLLAGVLDAESSSNSRDLLWEVCKGLDNVHSLPGDLRGSIDAKAELASMVFLNAPSRLNRDVSQAVIESLDHDRTGNLARPTQDVTVAYWLVRDLGALREGLTWVNEETLRLRMKTGMEKLPRPAPVEPPPLSGTALLGWLEQQHEFAGLARLARRLMAVIHVPRPLHQAEELPVGGVTDIAPRGPLDRLLLSELAHDDLTLAVRVAMNEALYFRRESPPKTPPRQRHVMLDAGLHSWGLPRLYGTAVALAMTAHHEKDIAVVAHRANGMALTPVVMHTAEGLREHMAALDHRLHPGEALPALVEMLTADEGGDAVIVTAAESMAEPEFQRALEQTLVGTVYLATVSRDGCFELRQVSRAGRKILCKARLPLEEILEGRSTAARLRDKARAALPLIFGAKRFPLLLSAQRTLENSWYLDGWGVLTLTGDGRLLRWTQREFGARQLATGVPPGRIHGVAQAGKDQFPVCLVVGKLSRRGLHAIWINREGEVEQPIPLLTNLEHVSRVSVDSHYAYLLSHDHIEGVNLKTGLASAGRLSAKNKSVQGLYVLESFADPGKMMSRWSRLTGREGGIELTAVSVSHKATQYVRMFDVAGVEGPVAVNERTGDLYYTATGERKPIQGGDFHRPVIVEQVSRDGRRLFFKRAGALLVVDTNSGTVHMSSNPLHELEPEIRQIAHGHSLRNRFLGIGVDPSGHLVLISAKRKAWTLRTGSLIFTDVSTGGINYSWHEFQPFDHEDVKGFTLQQADLPDGSRAVLDSRGLLHLRSSDKALPEFTIVLRDGVGAGWCCDGRVWGMPYFIGDQPTEVSRTISREVLQPFLERLR